MLKSRFQSFLLKSLNSDGFELPSIDSANELSDDLQLLINESPGGWSIDQKVSELLVSILIQNKTSRVVELGAGYSTLIFTYFLEESGKPYDLISIEQNFDWFRIPNSLERLFISKKINLSVAAVNFHWGHFGLYPRYEPDDSIILPDQIDLQVIDGPQYFFGREGGLDFTFKKLKKGALIIMDDAERYGEQCVIFKWLKVYQGLELVYFNEYFGKKGLAILQVKTPLQKKFSLEVFTLGLYQGIKRYWNLRISKS